MRKVLVIAALLFVPAVATADEPQVRTPDASRMKTDDCARARKANKPCVIDMGKGEDVEGNAPTAGGSAIGIIQYGKAQSLIRIRKDFIMEILKTAEDL
jgi:hypothetical protein